MIIIFLCVVIVITLVICLIYDNVENYRLLGQVGDVASDTARNPVVSVTKGSMLGVSVKYGPGSDYSSFHQKRARGQIRTTGEDS
jgi:hypothetical protein